MAVEYEISSDVATIKGEAPNTQVARVVSLYSGQITYDDEAGSKFATVTIDGKSQRVMLCIAVNGTVNYDDVPCLYSTVDGHRCLNIVAPTETGTPDDVPSVYETVVIDGKNVRAVRCILINATPIYDGVSSTCTFVENGKTHTAQLVNKITGGSVEVIVRGSEYIALPDAAANSLQYLKAFGGTEQRNLPDGYIQRQFIYMMDGSYLLTDIVPTYDCKVEMDFQTTTVPSVSAYLLGGRTSTYGGLFFYQGNNGVLVVDAFGTDIADRYTSSVSFSNNTRYKFTFNNKVATLASSGTTLFTNTFTGENANGATLCINALNNNGSIVGNIAGIYLYSFKVWNAQGELVADYVPAVQKGTVPVVGFYDTVSKTFKTATAGTFAAGGEAVPTPDTPMDIVSNNGVVKYGVLGKNLFDYSAIGTITPDPAGTTTREGIIIKGLKAGTYTFSCKSTDRLTINYIRVANGVRVDGTPAPNITTSPAQITLTGEMDEIRFWVAPGSSWEIYSDVQLELGSTATAYEPYRAGIYADGTVETINVHGKNLFDVNNVTIQANTAISADGSLVTNNAVNTCISFISVKPNTTYTISGDVLGTGSAFFRLAQYKADKTFISRSEDSTGERSSYTFTTGANTYYIRFHYVATADISTYQLELGSTATTYENYFNGGTATAEMLLKVGNYEDVQEILSGAITRNVGVKVLDGTEEWETTAQSTVYRLLDPVSFKLPNTCICSHYVGVNSTISIANMPSKSAKAGSSTTYIYIKDSSFSNNLAGFKQWLADQYANGTPVIVVYPLATPTTESVAGQTLQVQQGDNVVEITQASLDNLELEAKYQAAVSLTIQEVQDANLDPNVQVTIN